MAEIIVDEDNIFGNYYDRFNTKNPIAKLIMYRYIKAIKSLIHPLEIKNILEAGCGEGNFTKIVHELKPDCSYEAFDIDQKEIETNQERLSQVKFKVMSIYDMDYPDRSWDLITVIDVLEHLKNVHQALAGIKRICNKYVLFAGPREPVWRIMNIMRFAYLKDLGNTPGHINHWSSKKFVELLRNYFEIVKVLTPLPTTVVLCRKSD